MSKDNPGTDEINNVSTKSEERQIGKLAGVSIDGAPVSYVVVMAAVVVVLAFIPMSIVVVSGGSFPLSQGIYSLVAWILGPIAGTVANCVGALIGVFVAPHTTTMPVLTMNSALFSGLIAGSMYGEGKRSKWWIPCAAYVTFCLLAVIYQAHFVNGVRIGVLLINYACVYGSIILYCLPTRKLFIRWIQSKNVGKMALGLFCATWICSAMFNMTGTLIGYYMWNYTEEVFIALIPTVPFEITLRALVGTVIGTGILSGLRALGLVKPKHALY